MSLSQVRTYINQRVQSVNSDYVEWTDALNVDNIPNTLIDTRYHVLLGDVSVTHNDNIVDEAMAATVTVFRRAYNDTTGGKDALLDIGNCILLAMVDPREVESFGGDIKDVEGVSVTSEELDVTNDNIIKVEITLNFRLVFCAV